MPDSGARQACSDAATTRSGPASPGPGPAPRAGASQRRRGRPTPKRRVPRREIEARRQRMVRWGVASPASPLLVLVVGGLTYEYLIKPNQTLATVGTETISRQDYWKSRAIDLLRTGAAVPGFRPVRRTGPTRTSTSRFAAAIAGPAPRGLGKHRRRSDLAREDGRRPDLSAGYRRSRARDDRGRDPHLRAQPLRPARRAADPSEPHPDTDRRARGDGHQHRRGSSWPRRWRRRSRERRSPARRSPAPRSGHTDAGTPAATPLAAVPTAPAATPNPGRGAGHRRGGVCPVRGPRSSPSRTFRRRTTSGWSPRPRWPGRRSPMRWRRRSGRARRRCARRTSSSRRGRRRRPLARASSRVAKTSPPWRASFRPTRAPPRTAAISAGSPVRRWWRRSPRPPSPWNRAPSRNRSKRSSAGT